MTSPGTRNQQMMGMGVGPSGPGNMGVGGGNIPASNLLQTLTQVCLNLKSICKILIFNK